MIEKIEKLLKDVDDVLKEFKMGDTTEDYIEAVKIVRRRRGLDSEVQNVINSHLPKQLN